MRTCLILCALLGMSGIATAAPMSVNVAVPPGGEFPNGQAGVTVNNGSYSISGLAGQDNLLVTPAGSSTASLLQVYCTDIYDYLSLPATFTVGLLSDTLHDTTRISQINALLANGNRLVHDAASSAGLQFAIWEVEYETSGVYDVTSGNLTVTTEQRGGDHRRRRRPPQPDGWLMAAGARGSGGSARGAQQPDPGVSRSDGGGGAGVLRHARPRPARPRHDAPPSSGVSRRRRLGRNGNGRRRLLDRDRRIRIAVRLGRDGVWRR